MNKIIKNILYLIFAWFLICGAIWFMIFTAYTGSLKNIDKNHVALAAYIILASWAIITLALKIILTFFKNRLSSRSQKVLNIAFKTALWSFPIALSIMGGIMNVLVISSGNISNIIQIIKNIIHNHGI